MIVMTYKAITEEIVTSDPLPRDLETTKTIALRNDEIKSYNYEV